MAVPDRRRTTAMRRSYRAYASTSDGMLYGEPAEPPRYTRRAGWSGLVGDSRAYRLAQARAAGYRVMRLRTFEYPDGGRVQHLVPVDPDDLD